MISLNSHSNVDASVIKILKALSIPVDTDDVVNELDKHPDYPSLLAISDVLNNFDIENNAFRIQPEELSLVPCPFIVHTRLNGGDFLMVNKIDRDKVVVSSERWDKHKMGLLEFNRAFDGVVLTVGNNEDIKRSRPLMISLNEIKTPLAVTGLLLIFIAAIIFHTRYFTNYTWQILLLTASKTAGLITSILLLVQSIDTNNPLIHKLCTGNNSDCKAILSSKAAKLFKGLSWSEVGFFYFAGTWLTVLFSGHSTPLLQILAVLNVLSLPYTFYSIYYQARIAKQWCVLCCTVQALLWLEFIPSVTTFSEILYLPSYTEWSILFISFSLPIFLWVLVKPMLLKVQQVKPLREQLRKFKYNSELFNSILNNQPKYALPSEDWSIVLGNTKASNSITMATNPYCPPCSKTHKLLDALLEQRSDIQARIVFTATNSDEDIKTPVSRHLMALNELVDKTIVKKAMNDWYEQKQKDYKAWAKAYPVELNEANYYKLDYQKSWCQMAEVTATPTILLNGYRLPDIYQLPDLKYMLE
jgi:uncharacterized membrane protein